MSCSHSHAMCDACFSSASTHTGCIPQICARPTGQYFQLCINSSCHKRKQAPCLGAHPVALTNVICQIFSQRVHSKSYPRMACAAGRLGKASLGCRWLWQQHCSSEGLCCHLETMCVRVLCASSFRYARVYNCHCRGTSRRKPGEQACDVDRDGCLDEDKLLCKVHGHADAARQNPGLPLDRLLTPAYMHTIRQATLHLVAAEAHLVPT